MGGKARRRFARVAFALLVILHVGAGGLYLLNERQYGFLELWRDGRSAWRAGRTDEAAGLLRSFAEGYREAVRPWLMRRDFPQESQAWAALGTVERQRNRRAEALEAFTRAATLGDATAWRERHALLWELGDAAALEAQARPRLASGDPDSWQDLAAARWLRGDLSGTVDAYERALGLVPAWRKAHGLPQRTRDGGVVDEILSLDLLAGTVAWLGGDAARGAAHCSRLAREQDHENPLDGLCRAAEALASGRVESVEPILRDTPLAVGEQQWLAAEIRRRALPVVPDPQSVSPSRAPAGHPRR